MDTLCNTNEDQYHEKRSPSPACMSTSVTTPTLTSSPMPTDRDEVTAWQLRQEAFVSYQQERRENRQIKRRHLRRSLRVREETQNTTTAQEPRATNPTTARRTKGEKSFSNETGLALVLLLMMLSFGGLGFLMLYDARIKNPAGI
jgi:hypothetical protein